MTRHFSALVFAGALAVVPLSAALAQDQAQSFRAENARVLQGTGDEGALTLPSQASPPTVVANFLRGQGLGDETVDSLVVESEHTAGNSGLTHLRFGQQIGGLDVYGAYAKAAVNDNGELVHLIEALAPAGGRVVPANADPQAALDTALEEVHPGLQVAFGPPRQDGNTTLFPGDDFFHRDPTVTRVVVAMESGVLQEGFLVETWTEDENLLHHVLVGSNGRVLDVELRTNNDSYNVFPEYPGKTPQAVVAGPGAGNTESPNGWLFPGDHRTTHIAGNNANAYLDRDNNDSPDSTGGSGGTISDGNFVATADLKADPTVAANQDVAVQNLFYFNNVIHDRLYRHGFIEGTGNFQEDNFGKGGSGSDSVDAEAQDGKEINNANFATPSDGSNPRMQMYLWDKSTPRRDGDLDSDIIWHEYGHGLTWRMIGSMSGPMSGAIGEGMSDALAIVINDNDVVGEYSYNNPAGIRSAPYTNYGRTYGDFTGSSYHSDGEIYAAIIWRLWDLAQVEGGTKDQLLNVLVDGMNFTPAGPAFENMRDGILASTPVANDCTVWQAFAEFGVGVNAGASIKRRGPIAYDITITEDFTVPSECSGGGTPTNDPPTAAFTVLCLDLRCEFTDESTDDGTLTWIWTFGDSSNASTSQNPVHEYAAADTYTVELTVTDDGGLSDAESRTVTVSTSTGGSDVTLAVSAFKVKGVQNAELDWGGASAVAVYVNGTPLTPSTTQDPYPHSTGNKGGGSAVYRVCDAADLGDCAEATANW